MKSTTRSNPHPRQPAVKSVFQNFRSTLQQILPRIEYDAGLLMLVLRDRRLPWAVRIMALTGIVYVFSPFDLIPDTVPVFGYFDDAAALGISAYFTRMMVPSDILAGHASLINGLSCNGTQFFSLAKALRDSEFVTAPRSLTQTRPYFRNDYLFVVSASVAIFTGFELMPWVIVHVFPGVYAYGGQARWIVGSVVLCVTAFELLLRAIHFNHPKINQLDPLVGWRPRPGIRGNYSREGESTLNISFNSAGYRDSEHSIAKSAGSFRIAVLGDSMAEAREVALEETFWKRLEKMLCASPAFQGKRVEVINFAVNGYSTAQEFLTLKEYALQYDPDLVLLAFFSGNDVTENSDALGAHSDRPYFEVIEDVPVLIYEPGDAPDFGERAHREQIRLRLLDDLRIYQFVREWRLSLRTLTRCIRRPIRIRTGPRDLNLGIYEAPQNEAWAAAWQVTEALIAAINKTAHQHGALFMLITLSNPLQVTPDDAVRKRTCEELGVKDLTYPDRRLAAFAKAHDIPCLTLVDGLAKFAADHNIQPHFFTPEQPGVHYRAVAHEFIAGEIARAIEKLNLTHLS